MSNKVSTVLKIVVGVILAVSIMFVVYYAVSYKSEANEVADLVNSGNLLMEEGQYEQAISYYERAMEHEQNDERLVMAIVEAYMRLGNAAGYTQEAVVYYNNALMYEPNNKSAYWSIANIYQNLGDEDIMLDVLRKGYEDTADPAMIDKVTSIENERARIEAEIAAENEAQMEEANRRLQMEQECKEMLEPMISLFQAKDYDSLKKMMRDEKYVAFADGVIGDNYYYLGDYDADGKEDGVGIAVYENGYYYYGDFSNGKRNGSGILMRASYSDSSSIGSFIYEGGWQDDMPNGSGTATSNYYKDRISDSDFVTKEISGNYSNGLENGDMTLKGVTKSGKSRSFKYKTTDGIAEKSSNDDPGIKGQYIIARSSDNNDNLTSDGSVRGIEGYVEEN